MMIKITIIINLKGYKWNSLLVILNSTDHQTKNIAAKITWLLFAGSQMQQVRGDGGSEARPLPNSCKQQHQGLPEVIIFVDDLDDQDDLQL